MIPDPPEALPGEALLASQPPAPPEELEGAAGDAGVRLPFQGGSSEARDPEQERRVLAAYGASLWFFLRHRWVSAIIWVVVAVRGKPAPITFMWNPFVNSGWRRDAE